MAEPFRFHVGEQGTVEITEPAEVREFAIALREIEPRSPNLDALLERAESWLRAHVRSVDA